jgi:hypothetical protein
MIGMEDESNEYRTAQIPADFSTVNRPPFHVTTECSDDENGSPSRIRRRYSRSVNAYIDLDDGDEDLLDSSEDEVLVNMPRRSVPSRLHIRDTPSESTFSDYTTPTEVSKTTGGELMAPHARFFIERDKSKCTIKFDPPVSGRFILLKMWSPHHEPTGNIDIQSVVAMGFSGPRLFPAVQLR